MTFHSSKVISVFKKSLRCLLRVNCEHYLTHTRHSCGSTYDIIPDLIENGVNILNPVQPLAKNMEPWRLKKEFGKDITFCGGIDVQELLPYGTPEQVKESVKNTIKIFGKNGGYILGPAQNIGPDVRPENIVAMYDAALEYGRYPL
jgi:uroporphyrinogen decarboxylase